MITQEIKLTRAEELVKLFEEDETFIAGQDMDEKAIRKFLVSECQRFTEDESPMPAGDLRKYIFEDGSSIITPKREHYVFYVGSSKDPYDFCHEGEDPTID